MGAIVWVLPAGDVNGDLFTDALDLQDFASHWLQPECTEPDWCGGADIDHSGRVDLRRFCRVGMGLVRGKRAGSNRTDSSMKTPECREGTLATA